MSVSAWFVHSFRQVLHFSKRPKPDASAKTLVSLTELYKVSPGVFYKSSFRMLKALAWSFPQIQWFFLERRSLRALSFSTSWGMNLSSWFTISRKLCSSLILVGSHIILTAVELLRSALIPSSERMWPRNLTSLLTNALLSRCSSNATNNLTSKKQKVCSLCYRHAETRRRKGRKRFDLFYGGEQDKPTWSGEIWWT